MPQKRKPKCSRRQTVAQRRYVDIQKKRRSRTERRRQIIAEVKRRRRIVRHYLRACLKNRDKVTTTKTQRHEGLL